MADYAVPANPPYVEPGHAYTRVLPCPGIAYARVSPTPAYLLAPLNSISLRRLTNVAGSLSEPPSASNA